MGHIIYGQDPTFEGVIAGRMDETAGYRTVRRRGSASWLLFLVTDGRGRWSLDGEAGEVGPGEALLLPPHRAQDYGALPEGWGFYWAHFHSPTHFADLLEWRTGSGSDRRIEARMRDLLGLSVGQPRLAMNALEEILIRLAPPSGPRRDPRIESALAHIATHLEGDLDIPTLAARAGLSADRFSRLFAVEVGEGPRDWVEARRLDHAERLLAATALPVGRIADACGFAHPFYFAARFKKRHGIGPTAWRKGE